MKIKISPANPYEDCVSHIRAIIQSGTFASEKIELVRTVIKEYDKTMQERKDKKVIGTQGFPRGDE
jgi:hypothetical protein